LKKNRDQYKRDKSPIIREIKVQFRNEVSIPTIENKNRGKAITKNNKYGEIFDK
jgi:hypothetical protein